MENEQQHIEFLKQKTKETKIRMLKMCLKGGYGHPTSAYSAAELVTALYYDVMELGDRVHEETRDRFIMSKSHASVILFPILNDLGFLTDEEFDQIMQPKSPISYQGNIHQKGMDFSGGSLGIGLGFGAGCALADRMNQREDRYTFCMVGDAELHEGSVWEAVGFAGHHKLKNLIAIIDCNKRGCSDYTNHMLNVEPIQERMKSFGWEVKRINGHDMQEVYGCLSRVKERTAQKPLCIIADTIKGNGVDFMADQPLWHGRLPQGDEIDRAFVQLEEEV